MKKTFTLILFFVSVVCFGQINLVPNPSFEDTVACPFQLDQVAYAEGWFSVMQTPDYFNACAPNPGQFETVSVPVNYWGYQSAASGNAYMGFCAKNGFYYTREYIASQLIYPLQAGSKYFISFKVNLANFDFISLCGCNKLGLLFSTVYYSVNNPAPICNCPQFFSDSIILDTLNWTTIRGSFIADSNYTFINIGNFFSNSLTDSIYISGSGCFSYYYIDDICVSTDSLTCNSTVGFSENNNSTTIKIFPNPATTNLTIESPSLTNISLYNILGKLCFTKAVSNSSSEKINVANLSRGIYFLNVKTAKGNFNRKVVLQ